jgi:hypothetical protein
MVWVIAFSSPDKSVMHEKVYESKIKAIYQTFCILTTPSTETKSIGLPADVPLSWFLHRHQDSFIVTGQLRTIYRD